MTDRKSFITAILSDVDDPAPHAVYADWLDEHGEHDDAEEHRLVAWALSNGWSVRRRSLYGREDVEGWEWEPPQGLGLSYGCTIGVWDDPPSVEDWLVERIQKHRAMVEPPS